MERKLRIAWFSRVARSTEPMVTFSQYCTDLLVPLMRDSLDIEIFCDLHPGEHCGVPRYHYLSAYQRHRTQPFDLFFYQLEDGPLGRSVRTQIGLMPGVTWVHDIMLTDPGAEGIHVSPWEHTIEKWLDPSRPFVNRKKPISPFQPEAYREVSLSPVVLFNTPWARQQFERLVTRRIEYVPGGHRAEYLPPPVPLLERKRDFESDHKLRIVAAGVPYLHGRGHKFLPALAELQSEWSLTWVIPAGGRGDAERLSGEFGLTDRVELIEGNTPELWTSLVTKSDVALHLLSSKFGHLGPYLELSMAAGIPVIALKCGSGETLPDDAAFIVAPGAHESTQIREILSTLAQEGPERFGQRGRDVVRRENDPRHVAKCLEDIFRRSAPIMREVMTKWGTLYTQAGDALLNEVKELIDAPVGGMPASYDSIVAPLLSEMRTKGFSL